MLNKRVDYNGKFLILVDVALDLICLIETFLL